MVFGNSDSHGVSHTAEAFYQFSGGMFWCLGILISTSVFNTAELSTNSLRVFGRVWEF